MRIRYSGAPALARALALGAFTQVAMTACDRRPAARADADVRDSAGVRIVELAARDAGTDVLEITLDTSWTPLPEHTFGELLDVAPLPDGGVAVLERYDARVLVASAGGTLVEEFGRMGDGPGEFNPQGLSSLVVTDSSLFVPDLFLQRISEFTPSGELLGTRRFADAGQYALDWRRHPRGGLAFRVLDREGDRVLRLVDGRIDTLHVFPDLGTEPNLLLPPVPLWDVRGDVFVTGTSAAGEVRAGALGAGATRWVVRLSGGAQPFTAEDRDALEETLMASVARQSGGAAPTGDAREAILAQVSFPEVRPVLADLRVAANEDVWVRPALAPAAMGHEAMRVGSAAGYGGRDWLVLDGAGLARAWVRLPEGFTLTRLAEGWAYGIAADALGVQVPARARLPW